MGAALGPLRYDRSAMLGAEIASFGIPMTTLEELKLQQRQVGLRGSRSRSRSRSRGESLGL